MRKRIYLDTETTGLDTQKHAIIEIAGIIEIDGVEEFEFSWHMCPAKGKLVNAEALKVNGITIDEIRKYDPQEVVYNKFVQLLDKYINKYDSTDKFYCYAYNSGFDQRFIDQWFQDNKNQYMFSYTHWPWISVDVLAAIFAEGQRDNFRDFKLDSVAEALGIYVDESQLHGGLYDVILMKQIYEILEKEFNV